MSELTLIQKLPDLHGRPGHRQVQLQADRLTLAKRRWRGVARDGREFGFDLEESPADGTPFHVEGDTCYVFEQNPEEIVEIPVSSIEEATRVAWNIGNLHFGVEARPDAVRGPADPAVLQFLAREKISYRKLNTVFHPVAAAHHHHGHNHD